MKQRPVLVIGAAGQVARALARRKTVGEHPIVCVGRPHCDITDPISLEATFQALSPIAVVNAAAYTGVDQAERDPGQAFVVNATGPEYLARLCRNRALPLVHLSTDYVFDGTKRATYRETDQIGPLSNYGASKAAGDAAIRATWAHHIILRTAWIYSSDGHNFLNTMLKLGAQQDEVQVVDDQWGSPTWAHDVAGAIVDIIPQLLSGPTAGLCGTYHLTNAGETTWFGFASEIFRLAAQTGRKVPRLTAIPSEKYPTLAKRPAYSVLDTAKITTAFGVRLPAWQASLARCFEAQPAAVLVA